MWNCKGISKVVAAAIGLAGGVGYTFNHWATHIYGDVHIKVLNDTEKANMKDTQVNLVGYVKRGVDKKQEIKSKQGAQVSVLPKFPFVGSKGVASWKIISGNETKEQRLNVAWDATKRRRIAVCLQDYPGDDGCYTFDELTQLKGTVIKNIEDGTKNEVIATRDNISVVASMDMTSTTSVEEGHVSDTENNWLVNVVVQELDRNLGVMKTEKNSLLSAVVVA